MTVKELYEEAMKREKENCDIVIYTDNYGYVVVSEADWGPECGYGGEVVLS